MFAVRDRLHYDVHEGSGEPMLLVHGIMGGRAFVARPEDQPVQTEPDA